MSEIKVNKITPTADCGTVTLGDSGDTIAIPSGSTVNAPSASITNSGTVNSTTITNSGTLTNSGTITNNGTLTNSGTITNTGTISGGTITGGIIDTFVDWQTGSIKTANFTATAGEGYFCNTTSGAFTLTLPASPSAGDIVALKDYLNTFDSNALTIARNGSKIQGQELDFTVSSEGASIQLIYVDSTSGWLSTSSAKASDVNPQALFTTATGGNATATAPIVTGKL